MLASQVYIGVRLSLLAIWLVWASRQPLYKQFPQGMATLGTLRPSSQTTSQAKLSRTSALGRSNLTSDHVIYDVTVAVINTFNSVCLPNLVEHPCSVAKC